jgi:transposase
LGIVGFGYPDFADVFQGRKTLERFETPSIIIGIDDAACRPLETIPGIGFITATALVATVGDAGIFRSGRQFAAWLGLVPKQHSSGGKERMGEIAKIGDRYLRHLLVVGATAVVPLHPAQADDRQHLGEPVARA